MLVLIDGTNVKKYPYTTHNLRMDNPRVCFPRHIPDETLNEYGVYRVKESSQPIPEEDEKVMEDNPSLVNDEWVQTWKLEKLSEEELQRKLENEAVISHDKRRQAYLNESDPLFFKFQRGEIEKQEWIDKVNEIKSRYPK